ncbi:N-formylglutamate deformylase [Pelagimonas varians]|uniref:N-formylglutamate amidohydrolase n=1 Tax=Pelagimonas varians TaxID=696760 RepID=A0A238KPH3_9RHOB|nr:N-formylglutamate deformylase [Pelagimonas varians]PYG28819.1 formiminoglutamase [Pelagimonas varians]SMX44531.1 N-formylglutamate amidohydrolase [Pelagimonas varians]
MTPVEIQQGDSPIVLGLPHTGTFVPDDIFANLNARGRGLDDTDWHIHQLYDGVLGGATTVRATFHRYVIDANRDPSGVSLYPGQNTTGLVPLTDFDGHGIWTAPPTKPETEIRRKTFHAPYHAALEAELARVRGIHGIAILYDCHSIRSGIPFLFNGTLPDFNIGTNLGTTCAPEIEAATQSICAAAAGYTSTTNGRFKGGWTTRHYGRPSQGIHAIQMELAQSTYLQTEAAPWVYDTEKSARLRLHLTSILTKLANLAPTLKGTS